MKRKASTGGCMSDSFNNKLNGLSPVERLKVTDKYLSEMRGILMQMDEIAAFRAKEGKPASDEVGGYKRSSVINMIEELEKQKESILKELASAEKTAAAKAEAAQKAAAEQRRKEQGSAAAPAVREAAVQAAKPVQPAKPETAVSGFMHGDNALAIESVYSGLSMDIEKMRDDILQELKYSYKQDLAIYDDLSEKIEAIKQIDLEALEEKLRPLQALAALAEKLDNLQPLDYDALAEKVAEKLTLPESAAAAPQEIDYDELAGKVAALVAGGAAAAGGAQLASVENKIEEVQRTLSGAVSVKQMPEFKKLDALVAEYLKTLSYDLLPDILVTADSIKNTANRYIVSGNDLRGETMLSDLRLRLTRVNVWGASALAAVGDAVKTNKLPSLYSEDAFKAFYEACAALEQGPALPDDELAGKVARAKDALFNDADQRILDRDTLAEFAAARDELGGEAPGEGKVAELTELKKELMSFNLSYFIDFEPAIPQEQPASSVDTEAILNAIREMNAAAPAGAAPAAAAPAAPLAESGELAALAAKKPSLSVKKPRVLRPAVSSKDNKTEKTEQPLRTVRRSIKMTDENPDSLSKKLVEELALKIANSRVR